MKPSEMGDNELRLEIAGLLGWTKVGTGWGIPPGKPRESLKQRPPNWPNDIAAALELLIEKHWQYTINNGYVSIFPHEKQFWHNNTLAGIACAISKAYVWRAA